MDKDKMYMIAKMLRGMGTPPNSNDPVGGGGLMDAGIDILKMQSEEEERERLAKMMGNQ
jgi:hypothetical protein